MTSSEWAIMGWLSGWSYRKSHDIDGSVVGAQTDYQIPIRVHYTPPAYHTFASNGVSSPLTGAIMPSAVYYNGYTYIVWQGLDNTCDPYIIAYDHAGKAWSAAVKVGENPLTNDDHGAPCLCIDADGHLHVFYGAHAATPGYISHEKSDNPEDVTAWTAQANIVLTEPTYPNIITDGTNIWLFYRSSVTHTPDRIPEAFIKSTDKGASWGASQTIIDPGTNYGVYMGGTEKDGDKIHMAWVLFDELAGDKRYNVYHAYLDVTDNHMYAMDGTDLGTDINLAEANTNCRIVNSGANETQIPSIHLDENGYPHIIYLIETGAWEFRHIYWTGIDWSAPVTITTDTDNFFNFADFILTSPTDIEAYLTTTGEAGRGGDIEKWIYNGVAWTKSEVIFTESASGRALNVPSVPLNYVENLKLIFCQIKVGDYATTDLEVYAYGSDFEQADSGDEVLLGGKCLNDFGDIRFTEDDGTTELDYWLEIKVDYGYADFWVELNDIPADPNSETIYVYYGKDPETTTSDHIATMIKADDGATGNFTEDTRGTAALSYAGGSYIITEDSDDDAFASGMIMANWVWMTTIRVFEPFDTDAATDQVFFGLFDEDVVGQLSDTALNFEPKRRFYLARYQDTDDIFPSYIIIIYRDAGDTPHFWDGDSWELGIQRLNHPGDLELRLWSDGADLFLDVLSGGSSVLTAPAQIDIASVKSFTAGRCMVWAEPYTDNYYVPQSIDRYFVRKYVSPEPAHGAWGSEETQPMDGVRMGEPPIMELLLAGVLD